MILFQFSIIECVLSALSDEFPIVRKQRRYNIIFRAVFSALAFLLGIPMVCSVSLHVIDYVLQHTISIALSNTFCSKKKIKHRYPESSCSKIYK